MKNEELILSILQDLKSDMNRRFDEIDKRFEQVDKRFEQVDKRFEQVDKRFEQMDRQFSEVRDELKEIKSDIKEVRLDLKQESKRIDDIYHERKNIEIKWSMPFVTFNAAIAGFVGFFSSKF